MMNRSTWFFPLFISAAAVVGCRPAPESSEQGENRQHKAFQAHGDSLSGVWELIEFSHRGTDRASEFPNRVVVIEDDLAVTVIPANLYRPKTSLDSDGVVSVQPSLKTVPVQARIRLTGLESSDGLATFEVVSFGGIDRPQDTAVGRDEGAGSLVPGDEWENWSWAGRWRRTGDELTICLNISGEQPPPDLSSGDDRLLLRFRRGIGRLPEATSLLDVDEDEFESLTLPFLSPPRRSLDDVLILDYGPAMLAKRNSRRLWSRVVDYVAARGGGLQAGDRLTIAVIGEQARLRTFTPDDRHAIADWLAESNPHRHETLIPALQTSAEKLRELQLDHMHVEVLLAPVKASLDEDGLLSSLEALRAQSADELKLLIVPNRPKLPNISISGVRLSDRQLGGGSPIVPDKRVEVDVAVANHGDRQASFVLECKYGNENVASQRITLAGGSQRVVPVNFRCAEDAERIFTAALRDAEDEINALDLDDRIEVPVIPSGQRSILLVRTPKESESRSSLMGAFLKAALLLLNGELNGRQGHRPFAIQEMDFSEFATCNTEKYDLAIFESVSQFTPTQSDQLARLLGGGAPVWLCLASDADEQLIRRIRQRLNAADSAASFPFEISADSESESTRRKMLDTPSGQEFLGDGWSYMKNEMEADPLLQSEIYVMDYCHLQRLVGRRHAHHGRLRRRLPDHPRRPPLHLPDPDRRPRRHLGADGVGRLGAVEGPAGGE